jgi:23S rRNA (uracil1939-C5)-methyltransferase
MKIEKIVYGAKGMGYLDGKVCFVEGVLQGEEVDVEVTRDSKNFCEARVTTWIQKSPARLEPPCEYYAHCGGCQYQHMSYEEELSVKEAQVREMFIHHLGVAHDRISRIRSSGSDGFRYRNSATLRPLSRGRDAARLAYTGRDNKSPVVVDDCLLVDEHLSKVFQARMPLPRGVKRITFSRTSDGQVINNLREQCYRVVLDGKDMLAVSDGFFQNNHKVTELVAKELSEWVRTSAPFGFIDLYAGVGTFSVLSAGQITRLITVEENASCNECIRFNLSKHRQLPWTHYSGKVEKHFPLLGKKLKTGEFIVFMDPPRNGAHTKVTDFLCHNEAFRAVAYLSCDLGHLVRDLKRILAGNRYEIATVIPFDMFPRTQHIETLVLLEPSRSLMN